MHWQSTHTPHTQHLQSDPHLQSSWRSVVEPFCRHSHYLRLLAIFAEELSRWCLTEFLVQLCLRTRFLPLGLHRGILNFSSLLFLLISPNLGPIPHSHFLERELIHWVTKAKNVEWWHGPLVLRDFSQSNILDVINAWNDNSKIISEYYSRVTPLAIFQNYLNFNDISRKFTRVSRPLWSLLLWKFLLWRFLLNIIKIFVIKKITVKTIFALTM